MTRTLLSRFYRRLHASPEKSMSGGKRTLTLRSGKTVTVDLPPFTTAVFDAGIDERSTKKKHQRRHKMR